MGLSDFVNLATNRTGPFSLSLSRHFGEHLDFALGGVRGVEVGSARIVVRRVVTVLVGHFFLLARPLRPVAFPLDFDRFFLPLPAAAASAIIIVGSGACGAAAAGGAPGAISGAIPGGPPGGIIDGGCCIIAFSAP